MRLSRRQLLDMIMSTGVMGSTLCSTGFATTSIVNHYPRKLGLIFPPTGRGIPEEGLAMYGDNIEYLIETLGLETMTPEGYDAVIELIPGKAQRLVERGAEVVVLMGTSLSFYKGEAFNQQLIQTLRDATGLPVTTMSNAVIEGLKAVGAKRVAVATAYNEVVNDRLRFFLNEHDFEVLTIKGLGIEAVGDIFSVTQPQLIDFSADVYHSVEDADSILVSCGGLRTLEIIAPIEERTQVPVVSSMPHGMWACARLLEMDARVEGFGQLLSL